MLFTNSLAQKLGGHGVTSVSVHPGIIQTPLSKDLTMDDFMELGAPSNITLGPYG